MNFTRLTKIKGYISPDGLPELTKDLKYLFRRSFLGLPRVEISELFNLEVDEFKIVIPNHDHDSVRNASLTINDKVAIATICHIVKPQTVIEIGTFRGETTDLIAQNLVDADIYTLELPQTFSRHSFRADSDDLEVLKLRKPGLYIQDMYATNSRIHQIYGDSAVFNFEGINQTFDLAFIDGAHSSEYVKNDTEKLLPLMNPGGWIIWDDYSFSFPEIIQYVNTFYCKGAFHIYDTRFAVLHLED
ncbi:MAG: class I SAM-dependent methyltransferase [Nostoc sp.]|uniref:class I SAM-dependent methyltransferase n=1 Tax=Nostoc sp. TaxID=1180 RepID=UPI002FF4EA23